MALRRLSNNININDKQVAERIKNIKYWLLDMDGTITLGEEILPRVMRFFENLNVNDGKYIFVTNNSSHGKNHYMKRLEKIGINTSSENILISTDALTKNVKDVIGKEIIRVYAIGTLDFEEEISNAGIKIIKERRKDIDAVLVGFDTTLTYEKLDIACEYIRSGVPYYAANPDKVCPLKGGYVLPDCGAIISFLQTCTSVDPERIYGKPDSAMIDMILEKFKLDKSQMAMVGDRIYTDIHFAQNANIVSVAVLTGEAKLVEIEKLNTLPDFVFDEIGDIADYLSYKGK